MGKTHASCSPWARKPPVASRLQCAGHQMRRAAALEPFVHTPPPCKTSDSACITMQLQRPAAARVTGAVQALLCFASCACKARGAHREERVVAGLARGSHLRRRIAARPCGRPHRPWRRPATACSATPAPGMPLFSHAWHGGLPSARSAAGWPARWPPACKQLMPAPCSLGLASLSGLSSPDRLGPRCFLRRSLGSLQQGWHGVRLCGSPSMRSLQVRPAKRTGERGLDRRGGRSAGQRRARRSRCDLIGHCAASWASVLLVASRRRRRRRKRPPVRRRAARLRGTLRQWLVSRGPRGRTHEQRGRQQDASAAPPHGGRALRVRDACWARFQPLQLGTKVLLCSCNKASGRMLCAAGACGSCRPGRHILLTRRRPPPATRASSTSCRARHTRATSADRR